MKKKKAEKASTTPAAPKAPAPMPAFLADLPTSAFASSISPRTRVEKSAIALCTSEPTDGSVVPADPSRGAGDTVWATEAPPSFRYGTDRIVPHLVLGRRGGQLLLDQVHHRVVGQGG